MEPTHSISAPVFKCASCEHVYMEKVTQCDCTVGQSPTWIEGVVTFPKQGGREKAPKACQAPAPKKAFIIKWNCGYGPMYDEVEATSMQEAQDIVYEAWREDAETQADYEVIGLATEELREMYL